MIFAGIFLSFLLCFVQLPRTRHDVNCTQKRKASQVALDVCIVQHTWHCKQLHNWIVFMRSRMGDCAKFSCFWFYLVCVRFVYYDITSRSHRKGKLASVIVGFNITMISGILKVGLFTFCEILGEKLNEIFWQPMDRKSLKIYEVRIWFSSRTLANF